MVFFVIMFSGEYLYQIIDGKNTSYSIFHNGDMENRYSSCNLFSLNGFYTYFLCFISSKELNSPLLIIFAVILNSFRDLIYIFLSNHIFQNTLVIMS